RAWQDYAQRQARNRLANGLTAFYEGRHARARTLLLKAAEDRSVRDLALLGARQAALALEDWVDAAQLLERLNQSNPTLAASNNARLLLKDGKPQQALDVMLTRPASEWSPVARGIAIEAAVALGQFDLARNWLNARGNGLSTKQSALLRALYQSLYLQAADSADSLWQRWQELNGENQGAAAAFAARARALGMQASAAAALLDSLEARYQVDTVQALAVLAHRDEALLARLSALLPAHPADADLLHALGAWHEACGKPEQAVGFWQRAVAQGGGAESWNRLGMAHAARGEFEPAYIAENNARRVLNGETPLPMTGISLQQKIAAQAVPEQRNEHGIPLLPE
ncbi:MAG: heme biosynthesis protein HemY, partial [Arenimonas sp.]